MRELIQDPALYFAQGRMGILGLQITLAGRMDSLFSLVIFFFFAKEERISDQKISIFQTNYPLSNLFTAFFPSPEMIKETHVVSSLFCFPL